MTGDDRLRTQLEALERAAPGAAPPHADIGQSRRWLRVGLVAGTVIAAAAMTAVAIGPLRSLPVGAVSPSPNPPVTAETRVGDFTLSISSPKTVWTADEAIEVSASLTYVGEEPSVDVGIGTGLVFTARQISGGSAEFGGYYHPICLNQHLDRGAPRTQSFVKSGEIHASGPFDAAFFQDPDLHLPAGEWEFTARTQFADDLGCGDDIELRVSMVLIVVAGESTTPASETPEGTPSPFPTLSPEPTLSPAPSARVCMAALATGVLGADPEGNPVLIMGDDPTPVLIVFSYPEDYVIESTPVLTIYDRDGNVLAREGDDLELGGGFNADDTIFYACGFHRPDAMATADCAVPPADCELALSAAAGLISRDADPEKIVVWWGRGLVVWHAQVHVCWDDGRYVLIDVMGPGGTENLTIEDVTASVREDPPDNPPCD